VVDTGCSQRDMMSACIVCERCNDSIISVKYYDIVW